MIPSKAKMISMSMAEGFRISKPSRMDGIWISSAVNIICNTIEATSHLCGGNLKTLYLIERKLRAMISSKRIKRKKISVLACLMS